MVCAPVRSIIPSLKLGDYLSVQAHKPCSISYLLLKLNIEFFQKIVSNKYFLHFSSQTAVVASSKIIMS